MSPPVVAVVGTCDTKYEALCYIKHAIEATQSCKAILIDTGIYAPPDSAHIDIDRSQLLNGENLDVSSRDSALDMMARVLTTTLARLYATRSVAGVIGAGGSGNTTVCATAFRSALPIGFPKLLVSTMASGQVSHYVGETDMTMMYSVVDIAGMNAPLRTILGNAASAIAGMVALRSQLARDVDVGPPKPSIAVTMFGLTTPCVQAASRELEALGYAVVTFHATGAGGSSMERLIREGYFVGVLDLTTTELADELVGGVLTAGPNRLEAAADASVPQVVSVGALDMVNFGPAPTVPAKFSGRRFVRHNASVTLMRTTPEECRALGQIMAQKLNRAPRDRTHVLLPLRGVSGIDRDGGSFRDVEADEALFGALRLAGLECPVEELDVHINDPSFATAAVSALHRMILSIQSSA